MRPALLLRALTAGLLAACLAAAPALAQDTPKDAAKDKPQTLDKVSFGTNWVAEAEHGGFFQAVADGTYKKYGLDVTIVPGGPNDNNRMLLIAGKIDFFMAANTLMSLDAVTNNVPLISVAAIFQKDPQVFLTHPESRITKLEELKPLTLFVSKEGMTSYYQWLKSEYGFSDKNVRPYTFNAQPFIATAQSAMQGYVTSEPFAVEKAAGFKPGIILLADAGYNTYSTLIEARVDTVQKKPDLVQRFVDASIIGWYNYLYGDNSAANAMIKKLNPEMTDELLAYSVAKMKDYGIVDSGDTLKDGIGAMSDERVTNVFQKMVKSRRGQARYRLPQVLYAALRQQGRRYRAAPQEHEVGHDPEKCEAVFPRDKRGTRLRGDHAQKRNLMAGPAALSETNAGGLAVSLRAVTKIFDNGVSALGPLDLDIPKGEFVSLLGPSGCGKSTALRVIAGLTSPTSGSVEVSHHAGDGRPGHSIGFVFQEPTLMPWTTVRENVRLPLRLADVPPAESDARIGEALARVGLADFAGRLSPRIVGRHEDAGVAGARAGHRSGYPADGRTVRGAGRDHPLPSQRRSADAVAQAEQDGRVRDAFGVRVRLSVAARGRDDAATGPHSEPTSRIETSEPRSEDFRTSAEYGDYCRKVSAALAPSYQGQPAL